MEPGRRDTQTIKSPRDRGGGGVGKMRKVSLLLVLSVVILSVSACGLWGSTLAFSPSELSDAQVGQPYEVRIAISGNSTPLDVISISAGQLPQGLAFTYRQRLDDFATISGTPLQAGQFKFTISAACLGTNVSGQTGHKAFTLVVK